MPDDVLMVVRCESMGFPVMLQVASRQVRWDVAMTAGGPT